MDFDRYFEPWEACPYSEVRMGPGVCGAFVRRSKTNEEVFLRVFEVLPVRGQSYWQWQCRDFERPLEYHHTAHLRFDTADEAKANCEAYYQENLSVSVPVHEKLLQGDFL